jgi:epoxyqueuosine reductase
VDINRRIRSILKSQFADYVGFADLTGYQDDLTGFGGTIVGDYANAISIGLVIPDSIVDHLPQRSDSNVACEYRVHGYDVLNQRLNLIASLLSSYLNQNGYRTLPIAAAERADQENAIPTVSHKMIAHIAGLGWIGKNCLLVTPQHGPRLRLVSVLTNAPVSAVDRPMDQRCDGCDACVSACPAGAIRGRPFVAGESREERLDFRKCQGYFEEMEKTGKHAVCGMCLYVCPHGTKRKDGGTYAFVGTADSRRRAG